MGMNLQSQKYLKAVIKTCRLKVTICILVPVMIMLNGVLWTIQPNLHIPTHLSFLKIKKEFNIVTICAKK